MKRLPALFLSLLLVACGGGGGSDSGGNGGNEPPNPLQQAALQILGDCAADPVATLQDIVDTIRAFPGSSAPPITIGDPDGNEIPFQADESAGAPIPELIGVFSFRDGTGQPIMPFTAGQLQMDVQNLIDGIGNLPDGTVVEITLFPIPAVNLESASMSQTMQGGLPTDIDGFFRTVTGTCSVDISFSGETILSLLGAYPNLTAVFSVTSDPDSLEGRVFFNGTATATIEVSINGTGPFQFLIDLDTGAVTVP